MRTSSGSSLTVVWLCAGHDSSSAPIRLVLVETRIARILLASVVARSYPSAPPGLRRISGSRLSLGTSHRSVVDHLHPPVFRGRRITGILQHRFSPTVRDKPFGSDAKGSDEELLDRCRTA